MSPDDEKPEKTRFKCPNCQQPIVSRFTYCKQCETKFGRDTLFSCPRCGALVKQLERVCPGCGARLTDWGVGAEWLNTPIVTQPPKTESKIDAEQGPAISKPLPEIRKPSEAAQAPTLAQTSPEKIEIPEKVEPGPTVPKPLSEIPKPSEIPQTPTPVYTPPQRATASKISRAEALGRTNGLRNGRINGTKRGLVNGTSNGRVNGLVNGTKQGRVNGFKGLKAGKVEEEQSFLKEKIAGKVPMWQALTAFVVVLILVSSAVILSIQPVAGPTGIVIDGQFSDWASISSYQLSDVLPGNIPQIIESKMNVSGDRLNVYMNLQDNAFSGSTPSSYYIFIDADSNAATGYLLTEHQFGADRMVTLSGWDGHLMETIDSNFTDSSDTSNWSAWYSLYHTSAIQSLSEIEMSIPSSAGEPLVQIMAAGAVGEFSTPIMSNHGTIVAKQTSLLTGQLATSASQSVIQVSVRAMGVPARDYSVTATISNATGTDLESQVIQVSSSTWTIANFTVNLSALSIGESFTINARLSSTAFSGPLDVDGEPIVGYYLSVPSGIVIDGVFGDWTGKKVADTDAVPVANPNIDIAEYDACTQCDSHFFYVGMTGEALGGADVPEERAKPSGGGGGQPPVVRLKKTGEDLLQAFIDRDPGNGTGKIVSAGNKTIGADYLVEMYGRKGHVTTRWVMQWSGSAQEWTHIDGFGKVGVGGQGIEFSVDKSTLGNLTVAEVIILTTDWKAESDSCWFKSALSDPWAITPTGWTASSSDGATWYLTAQGISLVPGDTIVAIAHQSGFGYVFAVTNTGRVYTWIIGTSTSWGTSVTNPTTNATDIVGIAPDGISTQQPGGAYILSADGRLWSTNALSDTGHNWVYYNVGNGRIANGIADFKDIFFDKRYYAVRSGSNTPAYWWSGAGTWTATSVTGSSATQSHVYLIPATTGPQPQTRDQIFVLCQDGSIRNSSNGGAKWFAKGNLPAPGSGPQSFARYVAIDRDAAGTFWAITNTSYCYKSLNTGNTWSYTGNFGMKNITSMACPTGTYGSVIPEFDSILIPIMTIILPIIAFTRKRRSQL